MTFEEALAQTTASGGWLIVFATSASSADGARMADTTLNHPGAVEWLGANALVVTVDVDAERALAETLKIRTVPTLIALKQGVERERLRGLRPWREVHWWLVELDRIKPDLWQIPPGSDTNFLARTTNAEALLRSGHYEEATERYVWLWNNWARLDWDLELRGPRAGALTGAIDSLVRAWPPAEERFAELRDQAAAAAEADPESFERRLDWVALNSVLGDEERTMAWFDSVKADPGASTPVRSIGRYLSGGLKLRGRWADLGRLYSDPLKELEFLHSVFSIEKHFRDEAGDLCVSLRAAGRAKEAREVREEALRLDPSDEMKLALDRVSMRYN